MITKIQRIRGIGLFNKFDWDTKIDQFKKFNAFYGWNGSGKTTISRIFSILETGRNDDLGLEAESICSITTNDSTINISNDNIPLPNKNIKVFNEDFIRNNLEWHNTKAKPILIIGKTKIDQSEKLTITRSEKNKYEQTLKHLNANSSELEKTKSKILEKARNSVIKDLAFITDIKPTSGRASLYRNYTTTDVSNLLNDDKVVFPSLDDEGKIERKKILNEKDVRQKLDDYVFNFEPIDQIINQTDLVASVTLSGLVMGALNKEIKENEELREWFKIGVKIHLSENTDICKFCNNQLTKGRLDEIDSFFDEAQSNLVNQIDAIVLSISQINIPLPENVEKLYKQLEIEYAKAKEKFFIEKQNFEKVLGEIKLKLQNKRKRPFEKISIEVEIIKNAKNSLEDTIQLINKIIVKHNETTDHFFNKRRNSAYDLELFLIGQSKEDFKKKFAEVKRVNEKRAEVITALVKLEGDEVVLKSQLSDHGIAAEKFNQMLNAFLGRAEISLVIADDGYLIMRNGKFAKNLSEGEKNAIALIFFLIKLQEDGFDSSKGIIVIDDPVSSFDSQHTYQAFNFIKSKIKEVNPSQLFLLTHNFHFFRQLRNWYKYEDAKCYHIKCRMSDDKARYSIIENLDPLLQKHDSEYTFLFKLVYERANEEEDVTLERDYIFPNVIRKLLENYLSMKVPIDGINIHSKLNKLLSDFTEEQISTSSKSRIEAYCQDNSHPLYHDSPIDFDERLMGELKQSCIDVINLIKITDTRHHFHLVNQIKQNQTAAA